MTVGILELHLYIPAAASLKDKRRITLSLKDRIKKQFNVSLAETGGQDTWTRCDLTMAMVAAVKTAIEREFNHIINLMDSIPEIEITDHWIDYV